VLAWLTWGGPDSSQKAQEQAKVACRDYAAGQGEGAKKGGRGPEQAERQGPQAGNLESWAAASSVKMATPSGFYTGAELWGLGQ